MKKFTVGSTVWYEGNRKGLPRWNMFKDESPGEVDYSAIKSPEDAMKALETYTKCVCCGTVTKIEEDVMHVSAFGLDSKWPGLKYFSESCFDNQGYLTNINPFENTETTLSHLI